MLLEYANPMNAFQDNNMRRELLEISIVDTFFYSFYKNSGVSTGIVKEWCGNEAKEYLDLDKLCKIVIPIHLVLG